MTGRVLILLSTYNGAGYLGAQLASLVAQTHRDWSLLWRDDGSTDATAEIMAAFAQEAGAGRCVRLEATEGRLGACGSFLALLRAAVPLPEPGDAVAFADQDDVWLQEKLARGVAALQAVPEGVPALYCARQTLVDAALRPIGLSPPVRKPPGFPAALTQNIATGCTVLLNARAAALVAGSHAPAGTMHDWWSYIVVTAADGRVLTDDAPVVLYRQHGANAIGAPADSLRRAYVALRRGAGAFMAILRAHVAALAAQPNLLSAPAQEAVSQLACALQGGMLARLRALLGLRGLRRQTAAETLLFRLWFLLG